MCSLSGVELGTFHLCSRRFFYDLILAVWPYAWPARGNQTVIGPAIPGYKNEVRSMNKKTQENIVRHGEQLLALFPNAVEQDPVKLCKRLRRIETAIHRVMEENCNGAIGEEAVDIRADSAALRVRRLLRLTEDVAAAVGLFINRDPRGYGILAPDLTE